MNSKSDKIMSLSTSYFSTPPTANINTYIGGIPSSIVSADGGRERLQAYDNIYDTNSAAQQQLTTLQNQVVDLRNQILQLQYAKASQTIAEAENWIANGDCSQFTLPQPVVGTVNAGVNNTGFILQGRCTPIMDRWYHAFEGAGFNASNLKMEAKQVNLTSYISGTPPFGTFPSSTTKGLSVKWYNPTNTNACFSLETVNTARYGGVMGIQHVIPNVREFVNKTYTLGFWIYSSKLGKGYVRVLRQYNTTQKGGASLDTVKISSFNVVAAGWQYITMPIVFPALDAGKTLTEGQHGCVIQIGPAYYRWDFNVPMQVTTTTVYGTPEFFTVTSPGVEFVFAEIQLRSNLQSLNGTGFPSNIREEERTLKYVTYVSAQKPSTMKFADNTPVTLALGQTKNVDEYTHDYLFPLRFASRLVSLPSMIIWGFKNNSTSIGQIGIRWNNTGNVFNFNNSSPEMWGLIHTGGLDMQNLFYYALRDGDDSIRYYQSRIDTMRYSGGYANAKNGVQIISFSESEMIFKTRLNIIDYQGSGLYTGGLSGYFSLVTNRTVDTGWFTCIVAECDVGAYGNQTECLGYIDFSFTAPTTLPL